MTAIRRVTAGILAVVALAASDTASAQAPTDAWQVQPSQRGTIVFTAQRKEAHTPHIQRYGTGPSYHTSIDSPPPPTCRSAGLFSELATLKDGPHLRFGSRVTLGSAGINPTTKLVQPLWPHRIRWDSGSIATIPTITVRGEQTSTYRQTHTYYRPDTEQADWASCRSTYRAGSDRALYITVSRLTPAVLIETDVTTLGLFGGLSGPDESWYYVASDGDSVTTGRLDEAPPHPGDLDKGWLLVFWGPQKPLEYNVWANEWSPKTVPVSVGQDRHPILIVFSRAPTRLAGKDGLTVSFDEPAKLVLMPLYGQDPPPADKIAGWARQLPQEVRRRCDYWAERLGRFPRTVRQSYAYDRKTDRVTVTGKVEYVDVRQGGREIAPLPPALCLAAELGMKIEFDPKPTDCDFRTQYGPWRAVDGTSQYRWSFQGLAKYLDEPRIGPGNDASRPLEAELAAEVDKLIEQPELAPWLLFNRRFGAIYGSNAYFKMPSETAYFAAQIAPALDADRRRKLADWLAVFHDCHPFLTTPALPAYKGPRREWHEVNPANGNERAFFERVGAPKEATFLVVRGLADYHALTGRAVERAEFEQAGKLLIRSLRGADWATCGWCLDQSPYLPPEARLYAHDLDFPTRIANSHCANLAGYIRLAKRAGQADSPTVALAWGRLAEELALRLVAEKYVRWLFPPDGPRPYTPRWKPNEGLDFLSTFDQFEVHVKDDPTKWRNSLYHAYLDLCPEVARFLAMHSRKEAAEFLSAVERSWPNWFLARTATPLGGDSGSNPALPELSYSLYLARAWVLEEPAEELGRRIDISLPARGDLMFMHKLAEAIKAARR